MQYTLIDYMTGELAYFRVIESHWHSPGYQTMTPLVPPALVEALNNQRPISDADISAAISDDHTRRFESVWLPLIQAATPQIEAFLRRFATGVWHDTITLHLTRYGAGGSYHPPGRSRFPGAAVTIRDPSIGQPQWTLLECLIHESIHLLVEDPVVQKHHLSQQAKEALVDKLCMSNEVMAITGRRYPPQSSCVAHLPANWSQLVCWQAGQQPTW